MAFIEDYFIFVINAIIKQAQQQISGVTIYPSMGFRLNYIERIIIQLKQLKHYNQFLIGYGLKTIILIMKSLEKQLIKRLLKQFSLILLLYKISPFKLFRVKSFRYFVMLLIDKLLEYFLLLIQPLFRRQETSLFLIKILYNRLFNSQLCKSILV